MKYPRTSGLLRSSSLGLKNHNRRAMETKGQEMALPPDVTDEEIRLARESGFHPIFILDDE